MAYNKYVYSVFFILVTAFSHTFAENPQTKYKELIEVIEQGKPHLQFRLRNENFYTKDPTKRDGQATILQSRFGFETAPFLETTVTGELTHVAAFLKHRYNPGIDGMGKPNRAVIPEPKGTGLTKALIDFQGIDHTQVRYGRQAITFDNKRMVHFSGFRYPKSFDGLVANTRRLLPDTFMQYAYLHQQNTASSNTRHSQGRYQLATHLININWQLSLELNLTGYSYFHKNKTQANHSTKTYGVRASGECPLNEDSRFHYSGEFAYQEGKYNNPNKYNASYLALTAGGSAFGATLTGGFESLEGHKTQANRRFQTPLGSQHSFQSWFDFENPKEGVCDYYVTLEGKPHGFRLLGAYHKLRYQAKHRTFGHAIDLGLEKKLDDYFTVSVHYTKFNAKTADFHSGAKLWITLIAHFG